MQVTIEMDMRRMNQRLSEIRDALIGNGDEGDLRTIVKDESRRVIAQIIRFTPPQSERQGERAIERELNSLISGAEPNLISRIQRDHGRSSIDAWQTMEDGFNLRLKWDHLVPDGSQRMLKMMHYSYRTARGKVPMKKHITGEWRARIVTTKEAKRTYIDSVKRKVGRWKASWCKLADRIGLKVQPWVADHVQGHPHAIGEASGLMDGSFPVVTFGSRAPGVGAQRNVIHQALKVRIEAMRRRVLFIISGYDKQMAKGMRIASQAAKSAESEYGSSGIDY